LVAADLVRIVVDDVLVVARGVGAVRAVIDRDVRIGARMRISPGGRRECQTEGDGAN